MRTQRARRKAESAFAFWTMHPLCVVRVSGSSVLRVRRTSFRMAAFECKEPSIFCGTRGVQTGTGSGRAGFSRVGVNRTPPNQGKRQAESFGRPGTVAITRGALRKRRGEPCWTYMLKRIPDSRSVDPSLIKRADNVPAPPHGREPPSGPLAPLPQQNIQKCFPAHAVAKSFFEPAKDRWVLRGLLQASSEEACSPQPVSIP